MSEVRLVVRDRNRSIHGTCHGASADHIVAALSHEPETIEEFDHAVARFQAPDDRGSFAAFSPGIYDEPYDAGLMVIDLEARLVACESTYSSPGKRGVVQYHNGRHATDEQIQYHLSDDWTLTSDIESWRALAERRRLQWRDHPALDVRAVLYGQPMLKFIANACWKAVRAQESSAAAQSRQDDQQVDIIRAIHAEWLLTPRDDLRGRAPRDLLLAKHEFISRDLQDRQSQWSEQQQCPPGLDPGTNAYRHGGFGMHEIVLYFDLMRYLLRSCECRLIERMNETAAQANLQFETPGDFLMAEVPRLEHLRDQWLDSPDPEFQGRSARSIIDRERRRIPEALSGEEAIVDHDCPCCQMMADLPGPMFWNLDGSGMDPDFAFSFHHTREEWEAEEREFEEFNRRFNAKREEEERLSVKYPGAGYADPDVVWSRSFVADDVSGGEAFLAFRLFAIGSHLAELIVDLKHPTEDHTLIDRLSHDFGNLREVLQTQDVELAAALIEPVLDRFRDTLDAVARARVDLQAKCADLQQRLHRFLESPNDR